MNKAELALTLAGIALQVCLLTLLLRTSLHGQFRAFFRLIAFSVASTTLEIAFSNSPLVYPWIYWVSDFFYTLLIFFSLDELFRSVFGNFYRMRWFGAVFPGIGLCMVAVAVVRTIFTPVPSGTKLFATIISLEIATGILQLGTFFLFLVLARFFRVRYLQHAFGIALGFGIVASGSLVAYLLRSEFGTKFDPVVRLAPPITYTLAVLVWLVTFLAKEQVPAQTGVTTGLTPEQMISDLKRYTAVAKRVFRQ